MIYRRASFFVVVAVTALFFLEGTGEQLWRRVDEGFSWSFPRDHWAHRDFRTEWWYFTGHLEDPSRDRLFGYQFTFFKVGLTPTPFAVDSTWGTGQMIMGHAAISDIETGEHYFSEVLYRETPFLGGFSDFPAPLLAWSVGPPGTDAKWQLEWNGEGFDFAWKDESQQIGITLESRTEKPLVIHGPAGISPKSPDFGAASRYYSFTRLVSQGELEVDGRLFRVEGSSWMDKEFSSGILSEDQSGWDWFSLQLEDGRDVMFYQLRDQTGRKSYRAGSLVRVDGETRFIEDKEWDFEVTKQWSTDDQVVYPAGWRLALPHEELNLVIEPLFSDQENRSRLLPGLRYYEGAVTVYDPKRRTLGRGYVELTGYAPDAQLPL